MIYGILARSVYTPNWLRFFHDLAVPIKSGKEIIKENKTVHCLVITNKLAKEISYFG
jgi:hypothetical protein